jgi:Lrp/AsnC family transcriptional regulator, leucine-responsive regulatory protein
MDKTDMSLLMLLSANSRLSYAELAEKLNLSVNAVHKRIQLMIEAGVICKFTAKVSILASKAIVVYISGISQLGSFGDLPDKLKTQGSIFWLAVGGGKFLYIGSYVESLADVEGVVSYLKRVAGIAEPQVGIMASAGPSPVFANLNPADLILCDLDYRIIRSLKDDSRKAISDVAEELGVSAKTVRRRLERMVKNNLAEFTIEWYPDKSNDIITLVDVHFKPEVDFGVVPFQLLRKYAPNTLFFWCFLNFPNMVTFTIWTNTMNELQTLRESLEKEPQVTSVVFNILYKGYIFNTWRDKLVEKR